MENVKRKIYIGEVVSNKMNKSIVVLVNRKKMHPLYKKYINRKYKLMAHDEKNEAQIGDIVKVQETRPLSKRKRFCLIEIVKKAQTVD